MLRGASSDLSLSHVPISFKLSADAADIEENVFATPEPRERGQPARTWRALLANVSFRDRRR